MRFASKGLPGRRTANDGAGSGPIRFDNIPFHHYDCIRGVPLGYTLNKFFFICVACLAASCAAICVYASSGTEPGVKNGPEGDWVLYSKGLFYKSQREYAKAIKYFMDAAAYETQLDRVYYETADCYYGLFNYENAVNYAQLSIKKNPQFTKPYVLIYNVYVNLQNYEKAAEQLEALIDARPELVNIHYTLGNLYYTQMKKMDKAAVCFKSIVELSASEPVEEYYLEYAHYYLGHIYYSKGQTERSIEHFKKCREVNPDNYYAVYVLTLIYMDQYDLDNAEKYAAIYLEKYPENVKINSVMGRILYLHSGMNSVPYLRRSMYGQGADGLLSRGLYLEQLRSDEEAETILKTVLKNNSGFITPHVALARVSLRRNNRLMALSEFFTAGILLHKVRRYAAARECLLKALSLNETIPEIYFYLGRVYEDTGNTAQAIVCYKKAYELKPGSDLLIHIGYIYSQRKNFAEATRYMDRVIKMEPENSKPYFFKGILDSQRDSYPSAERHFKKAIELQKDNDTYHFYLATALEKQNKLDETIESLKRAIQYNPKNDKAYNFLGYLYADRNMNIDESITLIKKALEFEPANGAYLDSLGWAYYRKGEFKLALENLIEAEEQLDREKNPDPVVFDHIGDTYRMIGDIKKAVEYWNKSIRLKKDPKIEKKIREHKNLNR